MLGCSIKQDGFRAPRYAKAVEWFLDIKASVNVTDTYKGNELIENQSTHAHTSLRAHTHATRTQPLHRLHTSILGCAIVTQSTGDTPLPLAARRGDVK